MRTYTHPELSDLFDDHRAFSLTRDINGKRDTVHYPAGWWDKASPEEIEALGFQPVPEPPEHDPLTHDVLWDSSTSTWQLQPKSVQTVTPRQIRLALKQTGMAEQVESYVANLDEESLIEWEYATEIDRANPLIVGAQAALRMTDDDVDALFRHAAAL